MRRRERWIDVCKGYLIIMVVIGHVVSAFQSANMFVDNLICSFLHDFVYTFHMAAFFFVSGYLYTNCGSNNLPLEKKLLKRIIAYGIPYTIFTALYYIFKIVFSSYVNSKVNSVDLLAAFIKPFGYLWFIYALMLIEIIQDIVQEICGKRKAGEKLKYYLTAVAILLSIVQYYCSKHLNSHFTDYVVSDIMRMWIYFLLGVYFGKMILKAIKDLNTKTIITVTAVFFVLNFACFNKMIYKSWITTFLMALCGIIICIYISTRFTECGLIEYIGKMSLPIYLLHDYILTVCRIVVNAFHINEWSIAFAISFCSALTLPIIACILSKKIFHLDFVFYPSRYLITKKETTQ